MIDFNYAITIVALVVVLAIALGDKESAKQLIDVLRDAIKRIGKK